MRPGLCWLIGAWLWLACAGAAVAAALDAPKPRQLSVLDGLPSNRINGIAEDRQGYLWIATRDGLARYDGVGFRIWRVGDGLRDNVVWSVHVDAQDRVWIGTDNAGLSMLDPERRRFRHYDRRSHPRIGNDTIWAIASTPDGALWFGTAIGGLHRMRVDGRIERFMPVPDDPASLPSASVTALRVDAQGRLWVATTGGVACWTGRGFEAVRLLGEDMRVDSLAPDDGGRLWMGVRGAGQVRDADGGVRRMPFLDPVLGEPALQMLLQDRQGARWLDTRSGLARERGGKVENVELYSNTSRGVVRPSWSAAYQDREGGLWFGSTDTGLWHLPANWRDFSLLGRRVDDPASLANAFVRGVAPARSEGLWLVGSGGALDRLDPNTGTVEHVMQLVCGLARGESVHEAADGGVWVGCLNGELVRIDPSSGRARHWRQGDPAEAPPPEAIFQIAELRDGTLWFADRTMVQIRDAGGRVLDQIQAGDGRGLSAGAVIDQLSPAPDGGIWLAGSQGLSMWNAGQRRFEPVPGAPRAAIDGFVVARNGRVWIALTGKLSSYRWDGGRLTPLETVGAGEGIPMVASNSLAVDDMGTLWMTTVRGLVRYDPQRRRVRVYGVRDGLPSQEFSDSPIRTSPLGYMAVGTADGLLLFHPRQVQWSDDVPPLAIDAVTVRRGERLVELAHAGTVALEPGDRDLRIVARLLSFTDVHAHRYRFLLEGYEQAWTDAGASGERLFASLAPGRYRLRVQARTVNGEWSPARALDLVVPPPWWRTPWAFALFAIAALSLLGWGAHEYRARLKRRHAWQLAKQKQALAEQASEAKTRFLATLGHEVRTPMTGVLGMSELLLGSELDSTQRGRVEAIRRAGEHLLRLVNDALDLARIEAGKLELESGAFSLRALMRDVTGLMAPIAERRGLRFSQEIAADAPGALNGDRTRVAQILMNVLGNAIKFTEHGFVCVEALPLAGGGVRFVVSDSGPGLNEEQQQRLFRRFEQAEGARTAARYGGSGLGLAISQELAAAMGGRISVQSTPGEGTRFMIDLPLPPSTPTHDAVPAPISHAARGLRLLLVEDDPTVAEVLTDLLRAQGHDVVHAPHGLAALSEAATGDFDLGLLDLDLPGIDGLALARQLRVQGFAAPLVAVTARADADAEPLAREAGFDGFVRKPLTGAMLAQAIDAVLKEGGDSTQPT
jgi:signal transduction histidine kinase/streptogramin lyase/ActR/RegA family two-component response regulator